MKRAELVKIVEYIGSFKKLESVYRVDDTVLKFIFDKKEILFFDMTKGNSYIFKKNDYKSSKVYSAPFDIVLKKRCFNSFIEEAEVLKDNKIVRFKLIQKKSYKAIVTYLQLEFTGRHTNVVICDEEFTILEALRHIDKSVSYREIKNGIKLPELPGVDFAEKDIAIEDMKKYLHDKYKEKMQKKMNNMINQKLIAIHKKLEKLKRIKEKLPLESELIEKSKNYQKEAELLLANLSNIKNYQKEAIVEDYDGKSVHIKFPKEANTPSQVANILYDLSKKSKQKAKNIHLEVENLDSKIRYLNSLEQIIEEVKSPDELKLYFPKAKKTGKKEKRYDGVENFYFEGYKLSLGKNEKANAYLLKNAKMSDIWMHLKDLPSTHVIISSNKKEVPKEVLEFGARLCVKFSTTQKSSYLVDYTTRRNVKIISGAKVNYVNYKTLGVKV